jgi:hypothetical protein
VVGRGPLQFARCFARERIENAQQAARCARNPEISILKSNVTDRHDARISTKEGMRWQRAKIGEYPDREHTEIGGPLRISNGQGASEGTAPRCFCHPDVGNTAAIWCRDCVD